MHVYAVIIGYNFIMYNLYINIPVYNGICIYIIIHIIIYNVSQESDTFGYV